MAGMVHYAERGFRTARGVMGMTTAIVLAHGNLLLLRGVRHGVEPWLVAAAVWLLVLLVSTSGALRQLAAAEPAEPHPSPAARLAFRQVLLLPIVGTVPLWFLFVARP